MEYAIENNAILNLEAENVDCGEQQFILQKEVIEQDEQFLLKVKLYGIMKTIYNKNNKSALLLKNKQGFIFADTLLMVVAICSMLITVFVIAHSILNFFVDYIDTWMLQNETRRIFEDMATEIEYANIVKYTEKSSTNKELIIETYRRTSAMPNEYLKCLSFLREEPIVS